MVADLTIRTDGQPSTITDGKQAIIFEYISKGNYISTACQAAGIPQRTYHNWGTYAKDVEQYIDDNNIYIDNPCSLTEDEHKHLKEVLPDNLKNKVVHWRFFHRLKTAEAMAETEHVNNLMAAGKAGPQYWAASATYLERKHPDRWGKRDAVDINIKDATTQLERWVKLLREPD